MTDTMLEQIAISRFRLIAICSRRSGRVEDQGKHRLSILDCRNADVMSGADIGVVIGNSLIGPHSCPCGLEARGVSI
jgi:hypothetical protein